MVYENSLANVWAAKQAEIEAEEEREIQDMQVAERESDLDDAVSDFLTVVLDQSGEDLEPDKVDEIKEYILEYLAREQGLLIYRPMYLEDEDGEEFFSEFPYEDMIFEDE